MTDTQKYARLVEIVYNLSWLEAEIRIEEFDECSDVIELKEEQSKLLKELGLLC